MQTWLLNPKRSLLPTLFVLVRIIWGDKSGIEGRKIGEIIVGGFIAKKQRPKKSSQLPSAAEVSWDAFGDCVREVNEAIEARGHGSYKSLA